MILAFDVEWLIGLLLIPVVGLAWRFVRWFWPTEPLVAFGHPHQQGRAMVGWVDDFGRTQIFGGDDPHELTVSYIIENREASAIRDVTTGIWTHSGDFHPFHGFFVQILPAGQDQTVSGFEIPPEAMADIPVGAPDRVSRFI